MTNSSLFSFSLKYNFSRESVVKEGTWTTCRRVLTSSGNQEEATAGGAQLLDAFSQQQRGRQWKEDAQARRHPEDSELHCLIPLNAWGSHVSW
jgi:hypothetical protein